MVLVPMLASLRCIGHTSHLHQHLLGFLACRLLSLRDTICCLQAALRQFINEVMIRTGAVASAGFPISNCKVYSVSHHLHLPSKP